MNKNIVLGEKEEAVKGIIEKVVLGVESEVRSFDLPVYEIDLPKKVLHELSVFEGDKIKFVAENGRVYIEKA